MYFISAYDYNMFIEFQTYPISAHASGEYRRKICVPSTVSTISNCQIIKVEYKLHIKAVTNAVFDGSVSVEMPIEISDKVLHERQMQQVSTQPPGLQFNPIWQPTTSAFRSPNYQCRMMVGQQINAPALLSVDWFDPNQRM
jgi:hypothetical protein